MAETPASDGIIASYDGFKTSDDPARLDLDWVCAALAGSYWATGIPDAVLRESIENSICFGVYDTAAGTQIGFARVVTDHVRFAYLSDVFVDPSLRSKGLGKWLMEAILGCRRFGKIERWMLATRDAHGYYKQFGFEAADATIFMARRTPRTDAYADISDEK